ncbi:MAG: hypothetical protein HF975_07765 [ANME-2 cluster archaeon]|nr:hypothetical protein [ANME-2 cluster archaeon]
MCVDRNAPPGGIKFARANAAVSGLVAQTARPRLGLHSTGDGLSAVKTGNLGAALAFDTSSHRTPKKTHRGPPQAPNKNSSI